MIGRAKGLAGMVKNPGRLPKPPGHLGLKPQAAVRQQMVMNGTANIAGAVTAANVMPALAAQKKLANQMQQERSDLTSGKSLGQSIMGW